MRYVVSLLMVGCAANLAAAQQVSGWLSSEDMTHKLSPLAPIAWGPADTPADDAIVLDPDTRYQSILGMGASFEHATCYNLSRLGDERRREVIRKLVHPEDGIGMNLMRLCIGTSDFVGEPWYSYSDPPAGETDPNLQHFSIEKDRDYLLPVIETALEINPDLLYFASPWSPPAWMKTNGSMLAGKLEPKWYGVYADYLVKYVEAYAGEGIPIHAITPQNEPNFPNAEYPTCFWTPENQRDFIRDHLGPAFAEAQLDTEIWCWDHNFNYLDFPRTVVNDSEAAQYVDGVAFHHYEGQPEAMSEIQAEFPQQPLYFTEGSVFETRGAIEIIRFFRNWVRSYNAWVIMLDENRKPNNGPHSASETSIEYLSDRDEVVYYYDYYMYGQFMKYIPRGAVRIASTEGNRRFNNVAFETPDGHIVLVVANASSAPSTFTVVADGQAFETELPARSTGTYRWRAEAP